MNQFYVEIVKQRKRKAGKERYDVVVGYLPLITESSEMAAEIATKILDSADSIWVGDVKTEIERGL